MSSLYEFECKLYHQHLGHGADAEDIHGDADLHGRTCNQQNHPALVAVITRQSLINRVRPIVYRDKQISIETIVIITVVKTNLSLPLTHARFEHRTFKDRLKKTVTTHCIACRGARFYWKNLNSSRCALRIHVAITLDTRERIGSVFFFLPPLWINRTTSFVRRGLLLSRAPIPV